MSYSHQSEIQRRKMSFSANGGEMTNIFVTLPSKYALFNDSTGNGTEHERSLGGCMVLSIYEGSYVISLHTCKTVSM